MEIIDRSTMLGVIVNSCNSSEQKYYYARYKPEANDEETSRPQPRAES
jgi:hypothetical protein